jgi:exoribonuclease-2
MPSLRVAALESQGRVLLAALGERSADRWKVTTEDGRVFEYPEARLLWTARRLGVDGASRREVAAALKVLRAGAGPGPDWGALAGSVEPGKPLDLQDLAGGGADEAADRKALALALRAPEAAPRFRIDGGRLVAASDEEIRAEAERLDAARRAKEAEDALVAALVPGAKGPPPGAARPALDALLEWALGPEEGPRPPAAERLGLADVYEALERLEAAGLLPGDALPPLSRRGIRRDFPRKVLAAAEEAAGVPDPAAGRREDLRSLAAWAVDDPGTFEVDDALSLLRGPGGEPRLVVHISDAAAAVAPGDALDLEARRRAATVYIPDGKIPMLPPALTEARLSLEEGRDRAAVSAEIRVGAGGAPEAVRIFRSVVRVGRRLDYGATADPAALPPDLRALLEVARELRRARVEAGARVLELPSAHLVLRDGVPVLGERCVGGAGDVLVAEAMVAFNRAVGERLRAAGAAAIWRIQDPPRGDLPPREDPLFTLRARRLFAPVRYGTAPARHAGVGADAYLQSTSPIRRYSDLVHQRQLAAVLEGGAPPHGAEEVKEMCAALYLRERLVRAAEAEREDYWVATWLEARKTETFEGVVSRPPAHGRGHAWVPRLLAEAAFRWPKDRSGAPGAGTPVRLRPGRLSRHRGRIEFEVVG